MSDSLATLEQTSSPIDLRREDVQPVQEQLHARQVSGVHREHKLRRHDDEPGDAHPSADASNSVHLAERTSRSKPPASSPSTPAVPAGSPTAPPQTAGRRSLDTAVRSPPKHPRPSAPYAPDTKNSWAAPYRAPGVHAGYSAAVMPESMGDAMSERGCQARHCPGVLMTPDGMQRNGRRRVARYSARRMYCSAKRALHGHTHLPRHGAGERAVARCRVYRW
jgi:hypothetical protein